MDIVASLDARDAIRRLKARYWQAVDTKDAAMLRGVFTDDAIIDLRVDMRFGDPPAATTPSPDVFVARCLGGLAGVATAHHGHDPQITLLGEDAAEGVWAMEDNLWPDDPVAAGYHRLNGYGFYFDRYRRDGDEWRISATTLRRIRLVRS